MSNPTYPPLGLSAAHEQHLRDSAIDSAIIGERPYLTVRSPHDWRQIAPHVHSNSLLNSILHQGGIAFPIYRLGASTPYTWVLRPDLPRTNKHSGKPVKYEYPAHTLNIFDMLPRYRLAKDDPTISLWITEGAKKADALATAYGNKIVPVNENGVFGFRSTNAQGGKTTIADLDEIAWNGRTVVLAPDSDVRYNPQVHDAVQRLARLLLARDAGEVLILLLPMTRGGPKVGVDDYLAQGHTIAELESHLTTHSAVAATVRVPLLHHPDTGATLYLPPGYECVHQAIVRQHPHGGPSQVYSDLLFVRETGVDLHTSTERLTVSFKGRSQLCDVTAPRAELARAKGVIDHLAAHGAAVHDGNAKAVATFLTEFEHENRGALPHRAYTDRLGLVNDKLMLPAGGVGFSESVRYSGHPMIRVGHDADVYPKMLHVALLWPDAEVFWLQLALSLASPAIARIRPRRNPVTYQAGETSSGKTTLAQFAIGVWGDPTCVPFRVEAARTTRAGYLQTLEQLNGLPLFIDEAHTARDPRDLEALSYQFANGEGYIRGGADGRARGGEPLSGTLLLAGEALLEFVHAGAQRRVLWIDCTRWRPLGADPQSIEGARRAALLEAAWNRGAGLFGLAVAEYLWRDWGQFTISVQAMEGNAALAPLAAWREPLAIAVATLEVAFKIAKITTSHIPDPNAWFGTLLDAWANMLTTGHAASDPAIEAWARLVTMLVQAEEEVDMPKPGWTAARVDRAIVACRKAGEDVWRVLTTTPQFEERIGKSAVQLHGQRWVREGWVTPGSDGRATSLLHIPDKGMTRVLCIPMIALETWASV